MARLVRGKVIKAVETASAGVDYSPQKGALCPWCGRRAKIYKTLPWESDIRIRYHRCQNNGCVLASMKQSIKSIEVDLVKVNAV